MLLLASRPDMEARSARRMDRMTALNRLCRKFVNRVSHLGLLPPLVDANEFVREALSTPRFRDHHFTHALERAARGRKWDEENFAVARTRHPLSVAQDVQIIMAAIGDAIFRFVPTVRPADYRAQHSRLSAYAGSKLRNSTLDGRSADQIVDRAIDLTRDGYRNWRRKNRASFENHLKDCIDSDISNRRRAINAFSPGGIVSIDDAPEGMLPADRAGDVSLVEQSFQQAVDSFLSRLTQIDPRMTRFVECWLEAYRAGEGARANQFVVDRLGLSITEVRNLARRVREHARSTALDLWPQ